MSRTLILMRHAKSSWATPDLSDHDRPLNKRGRSSAHAMGAWAKTQGHMPDLCVSSSSTRTLQTFLGLGLDCPVRFLRNLYHAGPEMMMEVLQDQDAASVLMLGHNPGIADFALRLVAKPPLHPRFADYPTCATTVIYWAAERWSDIEWRLGKVIDFAVPRDIIGDSE